MNILGIDLGKFNLVCGMLNTDRNEIEHWSVETKRDYLASMLCGASLPLQLRHDLVVIGAVLRIPKRHRYPQRCLGVRIRET